ncbi:MAG: methyltransferase domain-containing protein [bacterium]|nr:MAG: methyltransferase domain-containing protein [bacterium]
MLGTQVLEERDSKHNGHLRVLKTFGMGTYIQANGLTQSGGIVESIWKQTIKQLGKDYRDILILGLGGGTLAKLLRKKYPEAKITGVEIDPIMVELGKEYFDLDKYDIDIKIEDTNKFKFGKYDLVIVDMYSGDNFPKEFESEEFLKKLTKFPTVVINRLYFGDKRPDTVRFGKKLEEIFSKVTWFYPEANLMFICSY